MSSGANGSNGNGGGMMRPPAPEVAADALRSALRQKAERIPLRALEKRGFRNVQVLDMTTIEKIVAESVTHCLERHTALLDADERVRLEAEARREFAKLLAEHKRAVAEKTEAERRRDELERQMQGLRAELARQQGDLSKERARNLSEHTYALSDASFTEMESKIRRLFAELIAKEGIASLAEMGPKALRGLSELERRIAEILDGLLSAERDRFVSSVRKGHDEKVGVLEKRISKLNKALAETEEALRKLAEAKAGDDGIASIFATIQGLDPGDRYYARKRELLEIIFIENLELKKKRDGAAAPAGPPPTVTAASLGFEPPLEAAAGETAF